MPSQEDEIRTRCTFHVYDPATMPWETVRDDVMGIEEAQFGEDGFWEEQLKAGFTDDENTAVIVKDNDKIVGFTYSLPTTAVYSHPEHYAWYNEELGRTANEDTAYISDIAIHPNYVGHRLAGPMSQLLEEALRQKGYQHIEQDAMMKHGHAANIEKNYQGRIVKQQQYFDPEENLGEMIFFRIRL